MEAFGILAAWHFIRCSFLQEKGFCRGVGGDMKIFGVKTYYRRNVDEYVVKFSYERHVSSPSLYFEKAHVFVYSRALFARFSHHCAIR